MFEIYQLVDPRDQSVRYVGMSKDAQKRLQRHLSQKDNPLAPWFQELAGHGFKPALVIIETVEEKQQARERELHWITYHSSQGAHLENYHGNSQARNAWKERESERSYLEREYSFIEDPQERQLIVSIFLEISLAYGYHWTENYNIVKTAIEVIQENHQIDVTWTDVAQIMAKVFDINIDKIKSVEE